ncbi:MAG: hypothetical protein RL266_2433 [Bacteroidota bacterium]
MNPRLFSIYWDARKARFIISSTLVALHRQMKKTVAIVFGGYSSEWVISELSAKIVFKHLDRNMYDTYLVNISKQSWDVLQTDGSKSPIDRNDFSFMEKGKQKRFDAVFNAIHGTPGEDGKLQGYWDMLGIPYTSPGVLASSLTFSKSYCNGFLRQFGDVNIAGSVMVRKGDPVDAKAILDKVGLPCFVKPNNLGSSFGITKLKVAEDFDQALAKALENDEEAVIEQFINGAEIASGVYATDGEVIALPLTEIVSKNEYFDYQAKYEGASEEITPARIPDSVRDLIQETTRRVFTRLKLKGMSRIDYIVQDGVPYLIEVNTIPGLSEASLLPQQVVHSGMSLKEFFGLLVEDASCSA